MPLQIQLVGVHQQATQRYLLLGKHEDGVLTDVARANLVRRLLQRIGYGRKILGDGAEVFAV